MRQQAFLPRIYYFVPPPEVEAGHLDRFLARCAELGFDHVLVPFPSHEQAPLLCDACARHGMGLLVDVDIYATTESHPHWFSAAADADGLPDPRRPGSMAPQWLPDLTRDDVASQVAQAWRERLGPLIARGVSGVRCMAIGQAPASAWRAFTTLLKAEHPRLRLLAWTPGCTPAQLDALRGSGFDATFSSGAWWDYRSRWLAEEHERLAAVAPPIAAPDSPDEPVAERLAGESDAGMRRRFYQRALRLAALSGNGILVPMGFEYGLPHRLRGTAAGHEGASAPSFDLAADVREANAFIRAQAARFYNAPLKLLSSDASGVAVLMRTASDGRSALLAAVNASAARSCTASDTQLLERADGLVRQEAVLPVGEVHPDVHLEPAGFQAFLARWLPPVCYEVEHGAESAAAAARAPRIAIEAVAPAVDGGKFPVKRTVGEPVAIEADVFTDGHDKISVVALWRTADQAEWQEMTMRHVENDRWRATLPLTRLGRMLFAVEAWRDSFATYRDELEKKTTAGLSVALELEEGRLLVEAAARHAEEHGITAALNTLQTLRKSLQRLQAEGNDADRIAALLSQPTAEAMRLADARPFAVRTATLRIDVERRAARFSSWYELFPRSQSGDPHRHGTFADVEKRLPAIQAMGFDTLYFTPIHPIGRKHRKGRNNSLNAGPEDPGSPYAIGSEEGGHDAIHPQLGTIEDFRRLRDRAAGHGLELALDFAIQCSPDHPWLQRHPDWFAWRPDGTIRYAENPPKKYQDIVNVDFYAKGAVPSLWIALRDAVQFWVSEGVRVFRVDNPHTKPLPFWEWLIEDIRSRHPDTIFLSEAFTRPKMMYRLAKVGYSQSYTYFTWRHTKQEFIDYLTELTQTPVREYFRPHFFVNTPDINPVFLQRSGRPGFLIRAALATLLSGLWGMYSGFELCEGTPVPGREEYLDSEKYEIRAWDWNRPGNIIAEITQLNAIRKNNPALHTHLNVRFLPSSSDNILFFLKATPPADSCERFGDNVVLAAINLDPFHAHEATLEIPLWEFGLPDDGRLEADDLLQHRRLSWQGKQQHVRLDPFVNPYAIWRIRRTEV